MENEIELGCKHGLSNKDSQERCTLWKNMTSKANFIPFLPPDIGKVPVVRGDPSDYKSKFGNKDPHWQLLTRWNCRQGLVLILTKSDMVVSRDEEDKGGSHFGILSRVLGELHTCTGADSWLLPLGKYSDHSFRKFDFEFPNYRDHRQNRGRVELTPSILEAMNCKFMGRTNMSSDHKPQYSSAKSCCSAIEEIPEIPQEEGSRTIAGISRFDNPMCYIFISCHCSAIFLMW